MSEGSGLFTNARPMNANLVKPGQGGIGGEVGDLRQDVAKTLAPMAAICIAEYINPLAAAANNVMAASVTPAAGVVATLLPVAGGGTNKLTKATTDNLKIASRQLTFTTAGSTAANAPATASVRGKDEHGLQFTEVVALQQVAGVVTTSNFFAEVDKITYSVGKGAGATIAIGLGATLGLTRTLVKRAGRYAILQESAAGSVVTTGTFKLASEGTVATALGTVDLVTAVPVMPTTQVITFLIEGVTKAVTFSSPADLAGIVSQVNAVCGAGFAAAGGVASKFLALSDNVVGAAGNSSTIVVVSGTGTGGSNILTVLGLTAGVVHYGASQGKRGSYAPSSAPNGATSYAVYYEYNGAEL
jgi:hypothetical protein